MLLDAGADPNVYGRSARTPLHSAAYEAKDARTVEALIAAGAEPDAPTKPTPHDGGGETPPHIAVRSGAAPAAVAALLAAGAGVAALDGSGSAPMHGLRNAGGAVAALLLEARDEGGRTALLDAAENAGNPAAFHAVLDVLEAGADTDARDDDGETLLHATDARRRVPRRRPRRYTATRPRLQGYRALRASCAGSSGRSASQ
ncbi:MAG: ankyrin repeat domain-containing protein [Gammaproteobacteria bacterium]|nr:ankyrin repeat domain-containing protein [Gammaproteobacteria bacterium]MDE0443498.1 ankyrin repeat domain-containing protein [Gammaproteobacteria bacterium]